ncbi:MAG: hypothetical protein D084_Lepto4C00627G0001 [Leptospirillum sp. Group IV 'UBA BS']|nr:MAG: hypothetical protein D084_Lepto4C00627G0001 [Leptospirillum sp. Group IV 'UBA BS']
MKKKTSNFSFRPRRKAAIPKAVVEKKPEASVDRQDLIVRRDKALRANNFSEARMYEGLLKDEIRETSFECQSVSLSTPSRPTVFTPRSRAGAP